MRIPLSAPAAAFIISLAGEAHAAHPSPSQYTFDPSLLGDAGAAADLSLFNEGVQLPGFYTVDILLNGERVDSQDVKFSVRREHGQASLYPCLSVEQLSSYGIRTEDFAELKNASGCADLNALPGLSYDFLFSAQLLKLSVPQIHLRPSRNGLAPRALWDDGIPAFVMNYTANSSRTDSQGGASKDSHFVNVLPGLNVGAWRLRNNSSWKKESGHNGRWQTSQTYAERGLYDLKSTLSIGDRSSADSVFDSIPFRGVMLASDEGMVPYTERAYAPVVRGIARTQARIEVRQNGYTLYDATVAPGPFALSDLDLADSSGGDLEVLVRETDGTLQAFRVPYQTPAVAVKEGYFNYRMLAGRYRPAPGVGGDMSHVIQASLMYGLPYDLTVYGGAQTANHYNAAALGLGISLGDWGATSLDLIGSRAQLRGHDPEEGAAWRLRYSKIVAATNTTFTVTGYRYATQGFAKLDETLNSYGHSGDPYSYWLTSDRSRIRSTTSALVSQTMGRAGNLGLNYSRTNYWHRAAEDTSYTLSYGIGLPAGVSATVSHSRGTSLAASSRNEHMTSLSLNVPLNSLTGSNMLATYQASLRSGNETHSAGLSGDALDQRLNWNVRQGLVRQQENPMVSSTYASSRWNGSYGQVGSSYSKGSSQRTMAADVSGAMVLHRNGLTLGQPFSGSVALVQAQGANGVPLYGMSGVKTDFRGYALQSSLIPYQENVVSLDPLGVPDNVEITQTDIRVVPTRGAVVPARFGTRSGSRALMTLMRTDGTTVPFGSLVTVAGSEANAGVVGSSGEAYLTGLPDTGELHVKWKDGKCTVPYTLAGVSSLTGVYNLKASCL
uniref:Putative fimbrial usher outer membrane porin n=1 Tax=Enterobacter cloacae TaxID=550 RepID=A0A1S6XY48_ENTCL|nr:fimbria/pilus outer membrane usher protein [Enterobacter cloacae]AQX35354.1 putative fimbrial usher outer membrane porin [Enterobacter cloacae]